MQKINDYIRAPRAKRLIMQWANDYNVPVDEIVKQREVAGTTVAKREEAYRAIREVQRCLRMAFDERDDYERDWFLFMARYNNAVYCFPLGSRVARLPGMIPMAQDTELDRAISFVQARLATRMAVCRRKGCKRPCFFRTRKGQKYCSTDCAQAVRMAINRRWFSEVGNARRRTRREKLKREKAAHKRLPGNS